MLSAVLQYHIMCRRRCFWISVSDRGLDCDLLAWTHLQHTHFAPALASIFARKCDGCTPELEMNLPIVLCPSSAVSCCNKFFSFLSITYQSPSAMILRILSSTVMLWNSYTIGVLLWYFPQKKMTVGAVSVYTCTTMYQAERALSLADQPLSIG